MASWVIRPSSPDIVVVRQTSETSTAADKEANFGYGDLFPLEDCLSYWGDSLNFEDILGKVPTLVIFAGLGCPPCDRFFAVWQSVEPNLREDCRRVLCLPIEQKGQPLGKLEFVDKSDIFYIDTKLFVEKYNLDFYPTLIAVDGSGFVSHIQYGNSGRIDAEIVEMFTDLELD